MKYIQQLSRQLALDYCCTPADILDQGNHFTEYRSLEGRRRFEDQDNCALKITAVNRKLIFTGKKEIIELCREKYETCPGAWFMDVANFRELDHILKPYGCQLKTAHPFFLPETESVAKETGFEIRTYDRGEILQFAGDNRFDEAFCFDEKSPDMLGVAAISDGKIIGMAGASADSPLFWQIGDQCGKRGGVQTYRVHFGHNFKRRDREIGKSAVLWNQYVKSCVTAGSGECRISRGMGGTSGGS